MGNLIAVVTAWALRLKPVRAFLHYIEHRGPILADSITYRTLFSVFAGVLLGFSLAGLWLVGNPVAWQALIDAVNAAIPGLIGEDGIIDPRDIQAPTGLTIATVLSLIGLVGAAIGAIGSLRTALRMLADRVHDDVFWVWVILRNLLLAVIIGGGFVVSAAATFLGTTFVGVVLDALGISNDQFTDFATRSVSVVVVLILDTVLVALLFRMLSGLRPSARVLWPGAILGGLGLTVLQQLSGLFVGGASANPLLTSFAALIALLLWLNLSAQVILIAASYIVIGVAEETDRVRERFGASTFTQRRLKQAETAVRVATDELRDARADEKREREDARRAAAKKSSQA
ncbi:ribonuclease BN [Microbacterium sp. Root61]|uniref:YihY/virulence factor BrkB family protein n=1 Tax=Microbacterium sp. Root61 TaxID=1736570 RepID=UPI0007010237|nr:YihY/virulence factor BrkB family protein [Microbacterium sp. Root61]KRA23038.1 ribonuclease BN [Microbacterium sp. Root61]